ncbi:Leucine-rich repeat-containing protein 14 [Taenia crassiceps]|uniref:Leucine-rich repeat-containing protein 14 n=1 Tax=Taenia crassiceps TaxID=6207 RepID=A0ABR4QNL5_9CEST
MHGCLTLIDYTWKESDDSECTSPKHHEGVHSKRRQEHNAIQFQRAATLATCEDRSKHLGKYGRKMTSPAERARVRRTLTVTDVYPPRQAPTYASWVRMHRPEFASVWYPFVHCRYRLQRDQNTGAIQWNLDSNTLFCTPRTLTEICIAYLIRDWPCSLPLRGQQTIPPEPVCSGLKDTLSASRSDYKHLSVNLFEKLLTEAIVQRDCAAISGLIANWPGVYLNVRRILPKEDFPLTRGYLTKPVFVTSNSDSLGSISSSVLKGPSLLDALIIGVLSRHPNCALQVIDVNGFEEDRRVSIELSRLPLLWMSPERRGSEDVRQQIRGSLQLAIQDQRFDRYFARISTIYNLHESDFCHEQNSEPLTICLDCNMSVDEVAFGLALQSMTPFRFSCNRLLMRRLPELQLPVFNLIRLLDPLSITQFELEDPELGAGSMGGMPSALGWLASLRNLRACSLPACIPPPLNTTTSAASSSAAVASKPPNLGACRLLNRSLISLRHLQRLSLARCYLQGQLQLLLGALSQPLEYLNLQDCCLCAEDVEFLAFNWRPLSGLYELNISRNNLARVPETTLAQLFWKTCFSHTGHLTCLSLAYTCLPFDRLIWTLRLFAREIKASDMPSKNVPSAAQNCPISSDDSDAECLSSRCTLRVLCIQNFIPPSTEISHSLLHLAISLPRLRLLQLYPAFYAFPGVSEKEQQANRTQAILQSNAYVRRRDDGCQSTIADPNSRRDFESRAEKLILLRKWIENDLPAVFSRSIFDTIDLFRPGTVLEIERANCRPLFFKGSSQANCVLALARSYFVAVSAARRIEVLSAEVDHVRWRAEASFRVVLLPSPTREERQLPSNQVIQRLEARAKWLDFRAVFYINKKGDLSRVKITRMNRRRKNLLDLSIRKLRLADDIVPITTDSTGVALQLQELLSSLESTFKEQSDYGGLLPTRFCPDPMENEEDAAIFQFTKLANLKAVPSPTLSALTSSPKIPILSGHPYIFGTVFTLFTASGLIS